MRAYGVLTAVYAMAGIVTTPWSAPAVVATIHEAENPRTAASACSTEQHVVADVVYMHLCRLSTKYMNTPHPHVAPLAVPL